MPDRPLGVPYSFEYLTFQWEPDPAGDSLKLLVFPTPPSGQALGAPLTHLSLTREGRGGVA